MAEQEVIRTGYLTSTPKRQWHLVVCREPDLNLLHGKHLILECIEPVIPAVLSTQEINELRLLTFSLAEEFAMQVSGDRNRWRVDFNGPAVSTLPTWHCHIKLPAGDDHLQRLAG